MHSAPRTLVSTIVAAAFVIVIVIGIIQSLSCLVVVCRSFVASCALLKRLATSATNVHLPENRQTLRGDLRRSTCNPPATHSSSSSSSSSSTFSLVAPPVPTTTSISSDCCCCVCLFYFLTHGGRLTNRPKNVLLVCTACAAQVLARVLIICYIIYRTVLAPTLALLLYCFSL